MSISGFSGLTTDPFAQLNNTKFTTKGRDDDSSPYK